MEKSSILLPCKGVLNQPGPLHAGSSFLFVLSWPGRLEVSSLPGSGGASKQSTDYLFAELT